MEQAIRTYLGVTDLVGRELLCLDEVGSTNTLAKKMALEGAKEGLVILADGQTAGRGRQNRSFESPGGKGIYLSVLLKPTLPPARFLPVTAMAGVAICSAVERVAGVRPGLKWPNDPVLGGRKLAGILTETLTDLDGNTCLILGVGLNVLQRQEDFSPELNGIATSLSIELGQDVSREKLAAELIRQLDRMYAALCSGDLSAYLAAYRRDCVHLGKEVRLVAGDREELVTALDISEDFGMVVRDGDGRERVVRSGEISVRGLCGYV